MQLDVLTSPFKSPLFADQNSLTNQHSDELHHPVSESLDALSFSVAWHLTTVSLSHYSPADKQQAMELAPALVAHQHASFDDMLRFCRFMFYGLHELLAKAVASRVNAAAGGCSSQVVSEESEFVAFHALKLLVETSTDVVTMLSSRRDASRAGASADTQVAVTPLKALSSSSPTPSKSFKRHSAAPSTLDPDMLAPSTPSWTATNASSPASAIEKFFSPYTCLNVLACAFLDSVVALTMIPNTSTRDNNQNQQPDEEDASDAFFKMSMLVGIDPDELLDRFLVYMRLVPYPIRRVWTMPTPSVPPTNCSLPQSIADGTLRKVAEATWSTTSRRLEMQRSVTGSLLETSGPSTPQANAALAKLWRYVS